MPSCSSTPPAPGRPSARCTEWWRWTSVATAAATATATAVDGTVVGITLPAAPRSTHGAGVAEALGLGRRLGRLPAEVVVIGIEGTRFSPGAGLSQRWRTDACRRRCRAEVERLVAVPA